MYIYMELCLCIDIYSEQADQKGNMYGECEVVMGSSSSSIKNPNFSFNLFSSDPIIRPKEEESKRSSEVMMEKSSGWVGSDDEEQKKKRKKGYHHRHTAQQIQLMEGMFKECPHPDEKQRLLLSQQLSLKPTQVKFWFQNRRTQLKAQHDKQENVVLRAENEKLKKENYMLEAALRNIVCPNCGAPAMLEDIGYDHRLLRIQNACLKDQYDRVCSVVSQYSDRPIQSLGPTPLLALHHHRQHPIIDDHMIDSQPLIMSEPSLIMEEDKPLAMKLAISSMEQVVKMCHTAKPLWTRNELAASKEVLNLAEYEQMFSCVTTDQFRTEASRDTAVVIMNSITLSDSFMDANKWVELFPSIISRAKTLQVVHSGVSGSLHLMYAEVQVLTPLVPTREAHFLRYSHHNPEEGRWAIVDFPLDAFNDKMYPAPSFPYYRRRPSGCLIQDMPNGYSRVTWVEHGVVEDGPIHQVFNNLVSSGLAFGASRWLAVLQRQCERLASHMARNIPDLGVIPSPQARKNLMNLAQRMIRTFCLNISASHGQSWTTLSDSGDDTVRITTRKVREAGQHNGLILTGVSTTWLPYKHNQVFDFLRDERCIAQLDVVSNGNSLHEVAHIANGSHPGNCISLLRINVASNSSHSVELVLEESCIDDSGSMVVYANMDVEAVQLTMNGEDESRIPLLPVGFVIVPSMDINSNIGGCLLTMGLQVVATNIPTGKLNLSSVTTINHHLCTTLQQIKTLLRHIQD